MTLLDEYPYSTACVLVVLWLSFLAQTLQGLVR